MLQWMATFVSISTRVGWSNSQVCGSSKEVSAKRKREKDEVEHMDEESE